MTVVRRVEFRPGWNKIDPDPKKNYGVHGMELRFVMIAPKGAVQFLLNTGWVPGRRGVSPPDYFPAGVDLGYHWPKPRYPGQAEWGHMDCDLLPGGECFYDGSGLAADEVVPVFIEGGDDAVWEKLDEYYRYLVETEDDWLAEILEDQS